METSGTCTPSLIERLDLATGEDCFQAITTCVKDALIEAVRSGEMKLPESVTRPCPDGYGRRLLHRDPAGRYTVVAMIWGEGQGTPIHDHDSMWCVECVYSGEILVTSYELCPSSKGEEVQFDCCGSTRATLGEAGALIPPHDYHVIENPAAETAVTIHVYGGEMAACNVYLPNAEGTGYRLTRKHLTYDH